MTTNLINGKQYIGQKKWSKYPSKHPTYLGSGIALLQAIKKYGPENFSCRILQWCNSEWELNAREKAWILMYGVYNPTTNKYDKAHFYNRAPGGHETLPTGIGKDNGFYGKHHSEEQKKKWSETRKGVPLTESHKENMRRIQDNDYKGKYTKEDILKIVYLHKELHKSYRAIVKETGISYGCVSCVLTGRIYSYLTGIHHEKKKNKLDENKVREIRIKLKEGIPVKKIAEEYGVHWTMIYSIRRGECYKNKGDLL